jgi:hypothetical protein
MSQTNVGMTEIGEVSVRKRRSRQRDQTADDGIRNGLRIFGRLGLTSSARASLGSSHS